MTDGTRTILIGEGGGYFNGSLDDILLFNRTLSDAEMLALYANQSSRILFNNFENLVEENHTYKAYTQDTEGNVNFTSLRTIQNELANLTSTLDLLFTNKTDLQTYKTIFEEGENFIFWWNWTDESQLSLNDTVGGCNYTATNVTIEEEGQNKTFTLCNSGCDFSEVREEFNLEVANDTETILKDFIRVDVCHQNVANQDFNFTIQCGAIQQEYIIDNTNFGTCNNGFSTVIIDTFDCMDSLNINLTLGNGNLILILKDMNME